LNGGSEVFHDVAPAALVVCSGLLLVVLCGVG
jgi:hypothetical protein